MPLFASLLPLRLPPEEKKKARQSSASSAPALAWWLHIVGVRVAQRAASSAVSIRVSNAADHCTRSGCRSAQAVLAAVRRAASPFLPALQLVLQPATRPTAGPPANTAGQYTTLPALRHSGQIKFDGRSAENALYQS